MKGGISLAELPICTVRVQDFLPAGEQERVQSCNEVVIEDIFYKRTLDSLQTLISQDERVEIARQRAIAYGFSLAKGAYKQTNQTDMCLVHLFKKTVEGVNYLIFLRS